MKKIILSILLVFFAAIITNVNAQVAPAVPDAPDLRDNNIRMRSVDLERTKRDAEKQNSASSSTVNPEIESKFPEIKEDFESIQMAQAAIVKAYTTGKTIDYKMIEVSANQINKNAKRLNSNLFSSKVKAKKEDDEKDKEMKNLIVELDNAIGAFTTSKMFVNLKVADSEVINKTQMDLVDVMIASKELAEMAKKMK